MYKIDQLEIIEIGVVGENEAQIIEIDVRPWLAKWPDASFGITATRPGEDTSYPCQSELENGILKWIVTGGDVAISGRGKMDVRAYQDTIVAKTPVIMTIIEPTMPGTEGEAPEAVQGWMDQAHGYQVAAEAAADEAVEAAGRAEDSADAAQDSAAAAKEAWEGIQGLQAEAETLPDGAEATAEFDLGQKKLLLGIPRGVKGDRGVSPTISTKKSGKVTTVTVTDAEGTKTFQISDGLDGEGAGDMLKSIYDGDGDGQVEKADYADNAGHATTAGSATNAGNAEKLGGALPSAYRKTADQIDYQSEIKNKPSTDTAVTAGSGNPVSGGAVKSYVDGKVGDLAGYPKVMRRSLPTSVYADSNTDPPFKVGMGIGTIGENDLIEIRVDYDNPNMQDDPAVYREAMRNAVISTFSLDKNDDGSYTLWIVFDGTFPAELNSIYFLIINHGAGVTW